MTQSRFDEIFPKRFEPLSPRGWALVIAIAASTIGILVFLSGAAPNLATVSLLLVGLGGALFSMLALYREWLIRCVNALRLSKQSDGVRVLLFALAVFAGPLLFFVVVAAVSAV